MTRRLVGIVTGGSSGIGRAIARAMVMRDYDVIVVGRNPQKLDETLGELNDLNTSARCIAAPLNVGDPDDMASLANLCVAEFGGVDVLVASAGLGKTDGQGSRLPTATRDLPFAEWEAVMSVNLHGVFLSNTAVIPIMKQQGSGTIVNISSSTTPNGLRGQPLAPAYCASKFAMSQFTRELADEVAEDGISISAVFPGSVETPLISNTLLDSAFGGRISADSFAAAVMDIIDLGEAVELPDPHLLPMPTRARETI